MAETATQLVTLTRSNYPETYHWGWLVITAADGSPVYCTPDAPQKSCFWRSSAKPFQLLPLLQDFPDCDVSPEEVAVACASHVASAYHLRVVENLLHKAGLAQAHLGCGAHMPMDNDEHRHLLCQGHSAEKKHNNCSGKHAAMLLHCVKRGWPIQNYLDADHPLQQRIFEAVKTYTQCNNIGMATDGCGAPTYYAPLESFANAFGKLGVAPEFETIRSAVKQHPVLIGGEGRVDTAIISATDGTVISKVGADGLLCATRAGSGEGLAIKIADGSGEIRDKLATALLIKLGWINATQAQHPALAEFLDTNRVNTQGKVVGSMRFDFLENSVLETYAPESLV